MNEEQIVQQLAQKVEPTQSIANYPEPPTAPEEPQDFVDKLLPEERLTRGQLLDYFAIPVTERNDPMVADYLNTIYDWARTGAGTGELNELLRVISEQEMHMGSKLKPDRLKRLGEYVKISRIRQQLAARERMLYNG